MDARHLSAEEIPIVLASQDDDARRTHLRECGRCQALQHMYALFLEPAAHVSEAERRDASARLRAAIAARTGGSTAPRPVPIFSHRPGWFEWWSGRVRWAVAAAAAVLCFAVIGREFWPEREARLREATRPAPQGELVIESMQKTFDGGLTLRWTPLAAADAYEVRFYDADLREITRHGPLMENELTLPVGDLRLRGESAAVLVRVVALRQEAPIATSPPRPLPQP